MIKIYSLHHPITGELRYIGKTNRPYLEYRLREHIKDSMTRKYRSACWIKSLLKEGLIPEIFLIDEVEEAEWQFWEKFYISYFKSIGCRLTNTTVGGDDSPNKCGRKMTEEQRKQHSINMSKPRKNKENFGKFNRVAILQYDKDNNLIQEWVSAVEAYRQTGIWKESIRNCCNGRSKSAGGYVWVYKNKKL